VLLVGGFGFIGSHVIESLSGSHSVMVLSDEEGVQKASHVYRAEQPTVEIGDIRDDSRVSEMMLKHRPEVVVHLAALTGIKRCNETPSLAFSTNVLGTYNVIMGCVACSSKLIFTSSREVYGETMSDLTREDDPLMPNNVYGVTKMLGERLVTWAASKYGLDYTILRLTNVYGPGGDQYNVQAMIRNALTEGKIRILGGTQELNLLYVKDAAETIRRCLMDARSSKQILNVGSRDDFSVAEIVQKLTSLLSVTPIIERFPMFDAETLRSRLCFQKLESLLQYRPSTALDEGLRETIEYYRVKYKRSGAELRKQSGSNAAEPSTTS
jgi:UDP-glucose 4-epimerase